MPIEPYGAADQPDVRASDAERQRVVDLLREHTAQGRLTVDEFGDRAAEALAAKTRGELARVLRDLPDERPQPPRPLDKRRKDFYEHLSSYLFVVVLVVAIWAATGAGSFWPIWVILPWGIVLLSHAFRIFGPLGSVNDHPR